MKAWFGGYLYQRKKGISRKIPAPIPMGFLAAWSTSQRRTWGTRSSQNLMRAHSRLRSVRSVHWAVKKALVLVEDKTRRAQTCLRMSKSSFLYEVPKSRILKGYCGAGESKDTHPHIYQARGSNQGQGQTHGVIEAHSCRWRRQR